jgi:TonB family protein
LWYNQTIPDIEERMTFHEKTIQNHLRLFVAVSVLFHLSMMALLAVRWPSLNAVAHPKPIFVSVIDPAELSKLPIGKETILPPKPKELPRGVQTTLPRSTMVPQQGLSASRPSSKQLSKPSKSNSAQSNVSDFADALPRTSPGPLQDTRSSEAASRETLSPKAVPPLSSPVTPRPDLREPVAPQSSPVPAPKQSIPGLPFVDLKDLEKEAKLYTDKEMPKQDAISINTDELRYLTYMLGLKRRIELIWQYPPQASASGIQGDLLLNFTIRQDGQLTDVTLIQSSGYRVLDAEAIRAVRAAAPYAPLPESWHQDRITITGNFIYYGSLLAIQ